MDQCTITPWTIPGADGQVIYGDSHLPAGIPAATLIICHGFKGYKDYGFFPHLAAAAAGGGLIAHRFNFSHSGMTNHLKTFERPDLFEADTWEKQIFDLQQVAQAVAHSQLPGRAKGPTIWFGHSRGGVTVLLTCGRKPATMPDRLIAAAAPHQGCYLAEEHQQMLRAQGYFESPSSRTGQLLRIGRAWLEELDARPEAYDPLLAIPRIDRPILLIHGEADPTVGIESSQRLEQASSKGARLLIIAGASHTFNAPDPLPLDKSPPPETQQMIDAVITFALGRA